MLGDITTYLFIIAAYLIGSISSAIVTCKLMGLADPRTVGSKNPGATNVLRYGGKKAAIFTLLGDLFKGLFPVLIISLLGFSHNFSLLIAVGFAAFLGHLYPVYYQFRGGKGVATALGVYLGLNIWLGLAVIGTWLIMAKLVNISSLSALVSTLLAPFYFYLLTDSLELLFGLLLMTGFIYWRHRSNIENLIKGTEGKIRKK